MFTRTKRLFGIEESTHGDPVVYDPRLTRGTPPPSREPEWQDDLDSLFTMVDSQMVERRAAWPVAMPGGRRATDPLPLNNELAAPDNRRATDRRAPAPPPPETPLWIGFGMPDPSIGADAAATAALSPEALSVMRAEVATAVREAIDAALQAHAEQVQAVIKERLDAALAKMVEAHDEERHGEGGHAPGPSRKALVTILVRRRPRPAKVQSAKPRSGGSIPGHVSVTGR